MVLKNPSDDSRLWTVAASLMDVHEFQALIREIPTQKKGPHVCILFHVTSWCVWWLFLRDEVKQV